MKKTIRFGEPYQIGPFRDAIDMIFPYTVVRSDFIGAPEEISSSDSYILKIGISRSLASCWDLQPDDLVKVLFEYGKRYIIQQLKDNTLAPELELWLTTSNYPSTCPFDPNRISFPTGTTIEVDTGPESLADKISLSTTARAIIEIRDNINALYHDKYREKLIILQEERDLLQFFEDCESSEEFSYRIIALRNAAVNLNIDSLRKVTGITDSEVRSIGLLEAYLKRIPGFDADVVKHLRELNKLRQGYPVHGDRSAGVIQAFGYYKIPYPPTDYFSAWRTLLQRYGNTLRKILELVREDVFPSQREA